MDFGFALLPNGFLCGIEYYPADLDQEYNELNIYIIFVVIHLRVYL